MKPPELKKGDSSSRASYRASKYKCKSTILLTKLNSKYTVKSVPAEELETYDKREIDYLTKKISQLEAKIEEEYKPKPQEGTLIFLFCFA